MNTDKLENDLKQIVTNLDEDSFIYDLLTAYGLPKASISRLRKGDYNLAKMSGEILWKKQLFFRAEKVADLHVLIDTIQNDANTLKQKPRFIIVTDFQTFLAVDTQTKDTLDIRFRELAKYYDFFLPWAGMEKTEYISQNPADRKAAERMGRLYDIIREDNPMLTEADRHALNVFLSRLLFCFFAEDTDIFAKNQFTNGLASHTQADGSDLQAYLQRLFRVLNAEKRSEFPHFLQAFPYVNGGLFATESPVPKLNAKARQMIIESGSLSWKDINPDIFGSMFQAVVNTSLRGNLGMHYTSVENIMKVIKPLFLDDLYEELEKAGNSRTKLEALLNRLQRLRFFDPACGSGNFLIIVYKELCKLEIEILKRLHTGEAADQLPFEFRNKVEVTQLSFKFVQSKIKLNQFYGIEIDDFAHETAKLSLWLAEHQMNLAFKEVFGMVRPTLPLQDGGNIICGNATQLDWEKVCPKDEGYEIYLLGNPPYSGARKQTKIQKADMARVFKGIKRYKNLDYIACWFYLGAKYIQYTNTQLAFVSTNSLSQGEQVSLIWPIIFNLNLEIGFAYQSFKWTNNAKGNAGVTVTIINLRNLSNKPKYLVTNSISRSVKNINPYLTNGKNIVVYKQTSRLSTQFPKMHFGNMPNDGGHLILDEEERNQLQKSFPESSKFIKNLMGSSEFIRGSKRYCLWILDKDLLEASKIKPIEERIDKVRQTRLDSKDEGTNKLAERAHQFRDLYKAKHSSIIVPSVSSERREYLLAGFLDNNTIITNLAYAIYDPQPWIFAIISSRIHMAWVRAVAGQLETRVRYSSTLCYNTFPFPDILQSKKQELEDYVFNVLEEREKHPEKTMAQLYDPDKMPAGLRQAHQEMDFAVEQCYRKQPFQSDEERLEYLFKLYEEMIEAEK